MNTRPLVVLAVVIVVGAFIGLLAYGLVQAEQRQKPGELTQMTRRPAPDFTLPLFGGGEVRLSELQGKVVVINFWASWCPPCREEAPILEKIWRQYREQGVVLIGVDIQDRESDALAYIKEFGITYPNGPDEGGRISIDYGVGQIPTTFFVSGEGQITRRWIGAINERQLVAFIQEALQ